MEDQSAPLKKVPPPWTCHYEAYIGTFYVSAKSGLPREVAYEPLEASSAEFTEAGVWKGGLVMIQLLRYSSTPVGPYDEMLLLPGNFEVPGGHGSHTRVTRIYVSQKDTTYNGNTCWCYGRPPLNSSARAQELEYSQAHCSVQIYRRLLRPPFHRAAIP